MQKTDVLIIGGGPCGLSAAIEIKKVGLRPVVIEKGNIVNAIYQYPTHQTFFSSSERLSIGGIPFITEERKPKRNQALVYYREVVKRTGIEVRPFETVLAVEKKELFEITTTKNTYQAKYVVAATGYYDQPNKLASEGADLPKVMHYFKEGHPFFDQDVLVIGGKNSAVDAALELHKAGSRVTVSYHGASYSQSIKPWILPEFDGLVRKGEIQMLFDSIVDRITEDAVELTVNDVKESIPNDFVFAMIGYHPDHSFLTSLGIVIDPASGRPEHNGETMETAVKGLFIAGVIAAGNNANEIFIENGRFHGEQIAKALAEKESVL
ncbi:YpdA family putative bacillithiol disulfide reductase [Planomicrobium sp. CPCC 101110]|uniref:YpdA family putative bacillithiol disulfide reductase n=1 Tax=Planomicrobium sp. CPCC 101110 TaxID=2599619 RepID=UPI0011B7F057|nr:YpdA family putative bacillithiol disulfide reductase [Planomicrobium sp. CPCC 101110]TWT28297.1 YpdA family putative bacillithiol disulfide reductase [Planomicrobium sp. CPCC 101110]